MSDSLVDIIRRILHLERRVNRLESLETPTIGGGGGAPGAPNDAQYVTLALDAGLTAERVLTEGADIDLVDTGANGTITVGRGGDRILLFDSGGNPLAEYAATEAGLVAALAASGAGDKVEIPQNMGALTAGITIPASVLLEGGTLSFSGFGGTAITLSAGSIIRNVSVSYNGAGNANATGIAATAIDSWIIDQCNVYVYDATASNHAISVSAATAAVRGFVVDSHGHSLGADARGIVCGNHVTITNDCTAWGEGVDATSCSIHLTAALATPAIIEWARGADGPRGLVAAAASGATIRHSSFTGSTTGLIISAGATLTLEDVAWNSITNAGTIVWQLGSRGNYSVEDYHATDIEAAVLTRHHTQPTGAAADAGKVDKLNAAGTAWVLGSVASILTFNIEYSEQNVANPPTENDVISAFGEPWTVGPEFVGILNDAGADLHTYACFPTLTGWWIVPLAKTAALAALMLSILGADSFTDADGTRLAAHTPDTGGMWTEHSGTWVISGNTITQTDVGAAGTVVLATQDQGTGNFKVRVTCKTAGVGNSQGGIVFRYSDASNFWLLYFDASGAPTVGLYEVNAGVYTLRASHAWTAQKQKDIYLEVTANGNNISVLVDGGYSFGFASAFNVGATRAGIWHYYDITYGQVYYDNFQCVALPSYTWTRTGTVLSATEAWEEDNVQEPTVLYDYNPQILTDDRVFKMWYTGGWATVGLGYAESDDLGATWTKYSGNPVLANVLHGVVVKFDGIYHYYGSNSAGTNIVHHTSSDGLAWTLVGNSLALGGGGAWDASAFGNVFVWRESLTAYYMIYEANGASGIWKIGLATSVDGTTWAKSGANPVLTANGSRGGQFVRKFDDGYYYMWLHYTADSTTPSAIMRYRSSNLTAWTAYPYLTMIPRVGAGEGEDTYVGQVADPYIVETGGTAYMFFEASSDGTQQAGDFHIILATADARAIRGY